VSEEPHNDDQDDRVLAANETFYKAFRDRDEVLMDAIWARSEPVFCIHPGWVPLVDRKVVLESFAAIMRQPGSPAIQCEGAVARVDGQHATVICFEVIGRARLVATNLFVRIPEGGWRIYHHHAGPTEAPTPGQVH